MSSCFWALLSLPDYEFLFLPAAIMNTTVDRHPIKDLLLGRSFIDFIHPDERLLANNDFNNFTDLNTLAGAVTRCRLRKLDCIPNYHKDDRGTDLDWIVVDVIMYTAAESIILAFFHCDQGYAVCPYSLCDHDEKETEIHGIHHLPSIFQHYHDNRQGRSHVSNHQEQSIGTLRAFQLYNNVTQNVVMNWPTKQDLPSSMNDIIDAIQDDFFNSIQQPQLQSNASWPTATIACTQHIRSTSNLTLQRHGKLRFEKILIRYGQWIFAVFQVSPSTTSSSTSPPLHSFPPYYQQQQQQQQQQADTRNSRFSSQSPSLSSISSSSCSPTTSYASPAINNQQMQSTVLHPPDEYRKPSEAIEPITAPPPPPPSIPSVKKSSPSTSMSSLLASTSPSSSLSTVSPSISSTSVSSSSSSSRSWRIKPNEKKRCESCQTSQSPEWRRGPSGHRTLCNACGLRYSRSLARQEQRTNLSPIISHASIQQQANDITNMNPILPLQRPQHEQPLPQQHLAYNTSSVSSSQRHHQSSLQPQPHGRSKYPGQRRFFNLYP